MTPSVDPGPDPDPDTGAIAFFASRLTFQTDVADVHAAFAGGDPGFALVDARGRAATVLDPHRPVVTYCWGPGCNGATRAALALARLGYVVREMLGGIEYWTREGFPVEAAGALTASPPDPLTTPCGC